MKIFYDQYIHSFLKNFLTLILVCISSINLHAQEWISLEDALNLFTTNENTITITGNLDISSNLEAILTDDITNIVVDGNIKFSCYELIGASDSDEGNHYTITATQNIYFTADQEPGTVIPDNFTIQANGNIEIPSNAFFSNDGEINIGGSLSNNGVIKNTGNIVIAENITNSGTIISNENIFCNNLTNTGNLGGNGEIKATQSATLNTNTKIIDSDESNWSYLTLSAASINIKSLIIEDENELTLNGNIVTYNDSKITIGEKSSLTTQKGFENKGEINLNSGKMSVGKYNGSAITTEADFINSGTLNIKTTNSNPTAEQYGSFVVAGDFTNNNNINLHSGYLTIHKDFNMNNRSKLNYKSGESTVIVYENLYQNADYYIGPDNEGAIIRTAASVNMPSPYDGNTKAKLVVKDGYYDYANSNYHPWKVQNTNDPTKPVIIYNTGGENNTNDDYNGNLLLSVKHYHYEYDFDKNALIALYEADAIVKEIAAAAAQLAAAIAEINENLAQAAVNVAQTTYDKAKWYSKAAAGVALLAAEAALVVAKTASDIADDIAQKLEESAQNAINAYNALIALFKDIEENGINPEYIEEIIEATKELLPIELSDFSVEQDGDELSFEWETESEFLNDYFTLEYSIDGLHFHEMSKIEGSMYSTENKSYTFQTPASQFEGMTYFRLKQTDINGDYSYSEIIIQNTEAKTHLSVYPNPTTDIISISEAVSEAKIFDISNKAMNATKISDKSFNVSNLPQGLYFIQVVINGETQVLPFVKE